MEPTEITRLLTIRQASERLACSPRTVYRLISEKRLERVLLGRRSARIRETDLVAFVDGLGEPVTEKVAE